MKNNLMVSIIIPTFNNSQVVCQAIDCALNQTYGNQEVIVVDDGSTDGTEQMLKKKYGARITCLRQENKGTGGARNTGIKHASGDYIQFLDADDLIDPDKISVQMKLLQNTTAPALSYCNYIRCDMDNVPVPYKPQSPVLQAGDPFYDIMKKWETEVSIPIHCFLFDAAFFKKSGILFDENLPANEDWECWMNVFAMRPKVHYIDKELALYRTRSGSRASDRLKMRNSYLAAIEMQIQKNKSNKEVVRNLCSRKKQIASHYRDASLIMRILEKFHPVIKKMYIEIVPWRVQRIFD